LIHLALDDKNIRLEEKLQRASSAQASLGFCGEKSVCLEAGGARLWVFL
jgi:hypothetical protein